MRLRFASGYGVKITRKWYQTLNSIYNWRGIFNNQ